MTQPNQIMGSRGDLTAAPGSREWAVAVRLEIWALLEQAESRVKDVRRHIQAMDRHAGWRTLVDRNGHPFASFADFCKAPLPYGLGHDPSFIDAIRREERDLALGDLRKLVESTPAAQAGPGAPKGNRNRAKNNDVNDVIEKPPRKTRNQERIARLKRDRADIASDLAAGKFPSVAAAWRAAGLERKPDPVAVILRLIAKLSDEDHSRLLGELMQ